MKEFMSTLYSFDNNGNKEDDESSIESSEDSQSDSEVVIQDMEKEESTFDKWTFRRQSNR